MSDPFLNTHPSLTAPATGGFAVTPSDVAALSTVCRALYVGSGGHLAVRMLSGETLTLPDVPSGSLLPLRVSHVLATGTAATGLVALY